MSAIVSAVLNGLTVSFMLGLNTTVNDAVSRSIELRCVTDKFLGVTRNVAAEIVLFHKGHRGVWPPQS